MSTQAREVSTRSEGFIDGLTAYGAPFTAERLIAVNDFEFECRRNCDILQDYLMGFEERRAAIPPTIARLVCDLISALDEYIADGYSYAILFDEDGNISYSYTEPNID